MKKILSLVFISLFLVSLPSFSSVSKSSKKNLKKEEKKEQFKEEKINENEYSPVLIGALLNEPENFIGKKIKFRGRFSSFTTLALDYDKALRKSKDYISICIFRPETKIPLGELKMAYPLDKAKENPIIRDVEEEDLLEIYGSVFSAELGEPWVDIISLKNLSRKINSEEKVAKKEKN